MLLNGTLTKDEDGKSYFLLYFTPIKKMNNNKATNQKDLTLGDSSFAFFDVFVISLF